MPDDLKGSSSVTQVQLPPITLDFETYYDSDYTVVRLDTSLYVRDPRFEVIGFSYMEEGQTAKWFSGDHAAMSSKLQSLELHRREVSAHNAMFDGAILEWVFGIKPLKYLCTMMAARPFIIPFRGGASLAICADFFGFPKKGNFVLAVSGKHRSDFDPVNLALYGEYSKNDTVISNMVRQAVLPRLPDDELYLIDLTIKKFLRGRLLLDRPVLERALDKVHVQEAHAMLKAASLGVTRKQIVSNVQFAAELTKRHVIPPMKISPTTRANTYAFSKKDVGFLALLRHSDPEIVTLVTARLVLKTNINRTRLQKFLDLERLSPIMPVPLMYYGAHTGRFSGAGGFNMQNLPRGNALRYALRAPPGFKVVVADLKAIEARITAVLAGEHALVQKFRDGVDVYVDFASTLFDKPVEEITEDERFTGKMCILGLGFGMGAAKFADTMDSLGILMTSSRAEDIVLLYRKIYPKIKRLWRTLDSAIKRMASLSPGDLAWHKFPVQGLNSPLRVFRDTVDLPNSMQLVYPDISTDGPNDHYQYRSFHGPGASRMAPIWGGTLCENVVQALARIVLARAEIRLAKAGLVSVMQVHDELVFVVPEHIVEEVAQVIERVLTDPVPWMPSLPLACTINFGDTYGEAK